MIFSLVLFAQKFLQILKLMKLCALVKTLNAFAILHYRKLFWNCAKLCGERCLQICEVCICKMLFLYYVARYPNLHHVPPVVSLKYHFLFQPFVAPSQFFLDVFLPSNSQFAHIFYEIVIYYIIWFLRLENDYIEFLFTFYIAPLLCLELGLCDKSFMSTFSSSNSLMWDLLIRVICFSLLSCSNF